MLQFTGFSESEPTCPCGTGEICDCGGRAGVSGPSEVLREFVLPKLEGPQCFTSYLMIASGWEKSHPDFFYIITKSRVQCPKESLAIVL
jgi:hypothetical protein